MLAIPLRIWWYACITTFFPDYITEIWELPSAMASNYSLNNLVPCKSQLFRNVWSDMTPGSINSLMIFFQPPITEQLNIFPLPTDFLFFFCHLMNDFARSFLLHKVCLCSLWCNPAINILCCLQKYIVTWNKSILLLLVANSALHIARPHSAVQLHHRSS